MTYKLNTGDLIDMMGARFEMVARMGSSQSDTVLFRTRMAPASLSHCIATSILSAFTSSRDRSRCS